MRCRRLPVLLLSAPLMLAGLSGCAPINAAMGALAGVDAVVAVPVFGRGVGDLAFSVISGRNCSMVRLEQGKTYCLPREPVPAAPPFCTRSLGTVDCWTDSNLLPGHPKPTADAPSLSPAQEADRVARWPKL